MLCSGCGGSSASQKPLFTEKNPRAVQLPTRFVWLSSLQETGFLPSNVALGGKTSGRVILYLEFPAPQRRTGELLKAYLVLDVTEPQMGNELVQVELSRAEPGREGMSSWANQPRATFPRLSAELAANRAPLRLDITELVVAPDTPITRLMLRSEPGEGEGVQIATGAAAGTAPRLELYWQ